LRRGAWGRELGAWGRERGAGRNSPFEGGGGKK